MKLLDNLTPEQRKAVSHLDGPMLVIAGAGTGKTRIITYRYAYLVNEKKVPPEKILAVTFTDKASREMQNRIKNMVGSLEGESWINTFHAFSSKVLKNDAKIIDLNPNLKVLNKLEQGVFFRKIFDDLPLKILRPMNNPYQYFDSLIAYFNRIKEELVGPDEYKNYVENLKNSTKDADKIKREEEILLSYTTYEDGLKASGSMDFASLIFYTCFLFKNYPKALKKYQEKFSYIMVDEYQDTNFAQNEIIKMLTGRNKNVLVVGDDDQSIYKFRGASVANILDFEKSFPEAKKVVLTKNFRSYQPILDLAYMCIQNNNPNRLEEIHRINKNLKAQRKGKSDVILIKRENQCKEGDAIAEKILSLKNSDKKLNHNQIAILLRSTKNQAESICLSLRNKNIPYCVVGESGFFQRKVIKDLLALLGFLSNVDEDIYLYRLLKVFDFSNEDLKVLGEMCKEKKLKLFYFVENYKEIRSSKAVLKLEKINKFYEWVKDLSKQNDILSFLDIIYKEVDYFKNLVKEGSEESILLNKFKSFAKEFQEKYNVQSLDDFLFYLDLVRKLYEDFSLEDEEEISSKEDKVQVMTVHKAKGLEFENVFIANLAEQRFPSMQKPNPFELPSSLIKESLPQKEAHLEEERRLFYVAATRAKNNLFLSYAENYGGVKKKKPSVFLEETIQFPYNMVAATDKSGLLVVAPTSRDLRRGFSPRREEQSESEVVARDKSERNKEQNEIRHTPYAIRLSYTRIDTYETCPLKYKYAYIDNIPYRPQISMVFGSFIHKVMEEFYKNYQKTSAFEINYLLKLAEEKWPEDIFKNKRQEEDYKEKTKEMLTIYFERNKNQKQDTVYVEKPFVFHLDKNITIIGRVDRIDKLDGKKIEIIDYKSSFKEPSQKDVDKDYQMTIYAMVVSDIFKADLYFLSVYYIMIDKKHETQRDEKDFKEFKELAKDTAEKIKSCVFTPQKGWHCRYCDYNFICPEMERKY